MPITRVCTAYLKSDASCPSPASPSYGLRPFCVVGTPKACRSSAALAYRLPCLHSACLQPAASRLHLHACSLPTVLHHLPLICTACMPRVCQSSTSPVFSLPPIYTDCLQPSDRLHHLPSAFRPSTSPAYSLLTVCTAGRPSALPFYNLPQVCIACRTTTLHAYPALLLHRLSAAHPPSAPIAFSHPTFCTACQQLADGLYRLPTDYRSSTSAADSLHRLPPPHRANAAMQCREISLSFRSQLSCQDSRFERSQSCSWTSKTGRHRGFRRRRKDAKCAVSSTIAR